MLWLPVYGMDYSKGSPAAKDIYRMEGVYAMMQTKRRGFSKQLPQLAFAALLLACTVLSGCSGAGTGSGSVIAQTSVPFRQAIHTGSATVSFNAASEEYRNNKFDPKPDVWYITCEVNITPTETLFIDKDVLWFEIDGEKLDAFNYYTDPDAAQRDTSITLGADKNVTLYVYSWRYASKDNQPQKITMFYRDKTTGMCIRTVENTLTSTTEPAS